MVKNKHCIKYSAFMKNKRTWAYQWTCWIGRDQQSSLSLTPSPALDSPKGLCTGTHYMPGSICCGFRLTNTLTHCIWNLYTHKYIYFLIFFVRFSCKLVGLQSDNFPDYISIHILQWSRAEQFWILCFVGTANEGECF